MDQRAWEVATAQCSDSGNFAKMGKKQMAQSIQLRNGF
jgi:hypothetical protein